MTPSFHLLLLSNQTAFQREVFAQLSGSGLTTGQPKVLDYLDDTTAPARRSWPRAAASSRPPCPPCCGAWRTRA